MPYFKLNSNSNGVMTDITDAIIQNETFLSYHKSAKDKRAIKSHFENVLIIFTPYPVMAEKRMIAGKLT